MFTWDTTQPLPARLRELLDRAGAVRQASNEANKADVLIFLPVDLILSCGKLSFEGIIDSYQLLLDTASSENSSGQRPVLINGSRLLSMTATELQAWQPGLTLPKVKDLTQSTQLHTSFTVILLEKNPELLNLYTKLDELSERGGAEIDESYALRIDTKNPEKLIDELNNIKASQSKEQDNEKHLKQLLEIEQECEKQFLLIKDLAIKFKITHALVKGYEQAINRFIALRIQSVQ